MDLRLEWKVSSVCGRNLKALDAFGNNCQRPVFSLGVSNIMHSITDLVTTLLLHKVVHHKRLRPEVNIIFERDIIYFSKTALLQREPFLTMLLTFISST